jgi:hypothetical protein
MGLRERNNPVMQGGGVGAGDVVEGMRREEIAY